MQFNNIGQDPLPTSLTNQSLTFPWYDTTHLNDANPFIKPGSRWQEPFGFGTFQYVKAAAALAAGQLVCINTPATDTVVAASSTTQVIALNTGGLTANAEVGNMIFIDDTGTSKQISRIIKANTATTVTVSLTNSLIANNKADPDVLTAVPANNANVSIILPFSVKVCTAALQPVGVALGAVTSGNYTIIQIAGYCHVTFGTTAAVVGVPAVPDAAGKAAGSGGVANVYTAGAAIIPLYAGSSKDIVCEVNFTGA